MDNSVSNTNSTNEIKKPVINNKPIRPNPNQVQRRAPVITNTAQNNSNKANVSNSQNGFRLNREAMNELEQKDLDRARYEESKRRYQQEQMQKHREEMERQRIAREQYIRNQQMIARRRQEMQIAEQQRIRAEQQEQLRRQEIERKRAEKEEQRRQKELEIEAINKHPFTNIGLALGIIALLIAIGRLMVLALMVVFNKEGIPSEQMMKFGIPYVGVGISIIGMIFTLSKTKMFEPTNKSKISMIFNCTSIMLYSIMMIVYFLAKTK